MDSASRRPSQSTEQPIGKALHIYAIYRTALAWILFSLFWYYRQAPQPFSLESYYYTTLAYAAITLASLPMIWLSMTGDRFNAFAAILLDILFITLIMHTTGGIQNSSIIMLAVTIAAANVLFRGREGLFFAAVASIALFYEYFYYNLAFTPTPIEVGEIGLFGAALFVISLLTQQLSRRAQVSEALAESRAVKIAELEKLNELIIQRLRTGVLAVDDQGTILLHNKSSTDLLQITNDIDGMHLRELNTQLADEFNVARRDDGAHPTRITIRNGPDVRASFMMLDSFAGGSTLIFLEDITDIQKEAQQLKLASLGRLTASIAHEIRNPLGAISHASQLLREDAGDSPTEQRLIDIILKQSDRVNLLVESVLNLSRRQAANPERISLHRLISDFIRSYREQTRTPMQLINDIGAANLEVNVDRLQLQQVLTNLADNARRYGGRDEADLALRFTATVDPRKETPVLDIIDNGAGIPAESRPLLFEPFFTTHNSGTGLGLYLCRELCLANLAWIDFVEPVETSEGAHFRISFAHPQRSFRRLE